MSPNIPWGHRLSEDFNIKDIFWDHHHSEDFGLRDWATGCRQPGSDTRLVTLKLIYQMFGSDNSLDDSLNRVLAQHSDNVNKDATTNNQKVHKVASY